MTRVPSELDRVVWRSLVEFANHPARTGGAYSTSS